MSILENQLFEIMDHDKFQCTLCKSKFKQRENLLRHLRTIHGDESHKCECNCCGQKKNLLQNKKYCSESSKIKLYRECKECNYIMSDMYFSSDIPVCDLCDMCDASYLD